MKINLTKRFLHKKSTMLRSFALATGILVSAVSSSMAQYTVDGYVYNDLDGMADNSITTNAMYTPNNGTNMGNGTYAILYNSSNVVVASVAVASHGYYSFSNVSPGNYAVTINNFSGTPGNPLPPHVLNASWQSTGERIGTGPGHDGNVDGHSSFFTISNSGLMDVNFGVRVAPTPTEDCYTNNPYMPVNAGNSVVVNGITITPTARSGSVQEGTQGVFGCSTSEITYTSHALHGGYDRTNPPGNQHLPPNSNTDWSITYSFSQPINNLRILLGSMGFLGDETLNISLDGAPATIATHANCYLTVNGSQITGGALAPLVYNNSGNGVFTLSKATPFTTVTFSGPGGYNGLNIEFCSSSIIPAPPTYSLSGTVFNDANGLTDGNVNGAPIGTTPTATVAQQLYANLLNSSNVVIATVPVSASNGTYEFINLPNGEYTVQLSTIQGVANQVAPATNLPSGWDETGEALGLTGNDGNPNQLLIVTISNSNVTNANFGIQRPPNSDNKAQTVPQPVGSVVPAGAITNNVSGLDAEDGTLGNANTILCLQSLNFTNK